MQEEVFHIKSILDEKLEKRGELAKETKEIHIGNNLEQSTRIGMIMSLELKEWFIAFLWANVNVFA